MGLWEYVLQRFSCVFSDSMSGFNNKILTSARNGELIMWDINMSGNTKYGVSPFSFRESQT